MFVRTFKYKNTRRTRTRKEKKNQVTSYFKGDV